MTADDMADLWASAQDPTTAWMSWAICPETDPWIFFPGNGPAPKAARELCADCPVRPECLDYALEHDLKGVWGGTTEQERRELKASPGVGMAA